jgi:hypothetical protein
MRVIITAITGRGESSTENEVMQTFNEVLRIANRVRGKIVYGKGFCDGTEIEIEK